MTEELKSCPFCGSKAIEIYESGRMATETGSQPLWTVSCVVCGVSYEGLLLDYEEVIRHWNRRSD